MGVMGFEFVLLVVFFEFDGNVIIYLISGKEWMEDEVGVGSVLKQYFFIEDCVDYVVCFVVNWVWFCYFLNDEKNVVVVFYNYLLSDDGIGMVFGMDSFESMVNFLFEFWEWGYVVGDFFVDGQVFIDDFILQLMLDDCWVVFEDVWDLSVDVVVFDQYVDWFVDVDDCFCDNVVEEWGDLLE